MNQPSGRTHHANKIIYHFQKHVERYQQNHWTRSEILTACKLNGNKQTANFFNRLAMNGWIEIWQGRTVPQWYILTKKWTPSIPKAPTPMDPPEQEVNPRILGVAIIEHIKDLEEKVRDRMDCLKEIQDLKNKVRTFKMREKSLEVALSKKQDKITELEGKLLKLTGSDSKGFTFKEVARIDEKLLNGKMGKLLGKK